MTNLHADILWENELVYLMSARFSCIHFGENESLSPEVSTKIIDKTYQPLMLDSNSPFMTLQHEFGDWLKRQPKDSQLNRISILDDSFSYEMLGMSAELNFPLLTCYRKNPLKVYDQWILLLKEIRDQILVKEEKKAEEEEKDLSSHFWYLFLSCKQEYSDSPKTNQFCLDSLSRLEKSFIAIRESENKAPLILMVDELLKEIAYLEAHQQKQGNENIFSRFFAKAQDASSLLKFYNDLRKNFSENLIPYQKY